MTYIAGPSRLWLPGRAEPVEPGQSFEHDFTQDGAYGPDSEQMLLVSGAISRVVDAPFPAAAAVPASAPSTVTNADPGADARKE